MSQCPNCGLQRGLHHSILPGCLCTTASPFTYAVQQPQHTWVGLTDEEKHKIWYEMQNIMGWYSFQEIAQAIEDKLKEKNNG